MNTPRLHALIAAAALSAGALSATATAADAPAASTGDCVQLGNDQQLVRANASRDVLLRNGSEHYRVHFQEDCSKAAYSRKLTFSTDGQPGQVCGAGRTQLQTDRGQCTVARVEAIDADTFKQKARQRSR
ncbi:hypothetical protein [Stenotrophomonas sp.]|uniref:hypothetical protein n=2 Tax=Pseudomonadota TaxID=1224 RepID=UPI0031DD1C66